MSHSYVSLPEGKAPFSYGVPVFFPMFYGFPMIFPCVCSFYHCFFHKEMLVLSIEIQTPHPMSWEGEDPVHGTARASQSFAELMTIFGMKTANWNMKTANWNSDLLGVL